MIFVIILGLILGLLFVNNWVFDYRSWRKRNNTLSIAKAPVVGATVYMLFCIFIPIIIVNSNQSFAGTFTNNPVFLYTVSIVLSFLISFFWFQYLWWIDIFEREKYGPLVVLFILACLSTWAVLPISELIQNTFHFHLNGEILNDALFSIFGIGLVEELAKIIPFLIVLKFSKVIDEPFDYILYGCIAALGFAFVENILYLGRTELQSLNGRSLFASVAHMIFTSIITYGMALHKFKRRKNQWVTFPVLVLLAALAHGFYDFWLINAAVSSFYVVTFIFLIIMIKVWLIMKNNLLNISPHFHYSIKLRSSRFKYRILNALLTISFIGYILLYMIKDKDAANEYLIYSVTNYMFILLFISINFSSFEVIRNYIAPFHLGRNIFEIIMPRMAYLENLVGDTLELRYVTPRDSRQKTSSYMKSLLPVKGTLIRRMVFDEDIHWYLFESSRELNLGKVSNRYFLIKTKSKDNNLDHQSWSPVYLRALLMEPNLDEPIVLSEDTVSIYNIFSTPSEPSKIES